MKAPDAVVADEHLPAREDVRAADEDRRSPHVVVLPSTCSVRDAAELKQALCAHAQDSAPVAVDVRSLERIDTATMQLLCAFVRDRAAREQQVEWVGDSNALRDAARLLGVTGLLALPQNSHNNPGAAA